MEHPKILNLHIADQQSLYKCFIPFISGGGLFLPTTHAFPLNVEILIVLTLFDEPEQFALAGKVVWITPAAAQNQRTRGIGLQFVENAERLKMRIEHLLSGNFDESTATLIV